MNEWTVKIQTSLNKYKAEEYPLFKSEVRLMRCCTQATRFIFPSKPRPTPILKRTRKRKRLDHQQTASADKNSETDSSSSSDGVEPSQSGKANSGPQRGDPPPAVDDEKSGERTDINRRWRMKRYAIMLL